MEDRSRFIRVCAAAIEKYGFKQNSTYLERFKKELKEIDAQSEYDYLLELHDKFMAEGLKFPANENNNLIDFLLGLTDEFDIDKPSVYVQGEFPDIDIDYLKPVQKYLKSTWATATFGQDNVCEIGTYVTAGIKSSILDMTGVHGLSKGDIQSITVKMDDKDDEGKILDWAKAEERYPIFKAYNDANEEVAKSAKLMQGRNKIAGVHAAGLIISSKPIHDFVPMEVRKVNKQNPNGVVCSAWAEGLNTQDLQPVGLIKFDLLVINNLMQIALACKLIKERHGMEHICVGAAGWDWSDISYLNDPKALAMANKADLKCIFQFDSEGIRKLVKRGGVTRFDDLAAYSALYRPGPLGMGMDARYCKRKKYDSGVSESQGGEPYNIHPLMEPLLGMTYGIMCIHANTYVSVADGREIPIKYIKRGNRVHSVNLESKRVQVKECHGCGPTKMEDGYVITLSNGFSVCLTKDHEVLTWNGMKEVQNLDLDCDLVACPDDLPPEVSHDNGNIQLADWIGDNESVAYLLGQLVGDGCMTSSGVSLCVGSKEACDLVQEWIVSNLPSLNASPYFHCRSWYLSLSHKDLVSSSGYGNRKTKFSKLLEDLCMKEISWHKRVPEIIMMSPEKIRLSFLAGLFDSDGHAPDGKDQTCNITSVSEDLLNDVRKLLLMQGIVCSVTNVKVLIWDQLKFRDFVGHKLVVKSLDDASLCGATVGEVPREAIRTAWQESGLSQREFAEKFKVSRGILREGRAFANSCTYEAVGGELGDLRYYSIKSIEVIPNQRFYAMSVADNHNLVANGVVVKNCYQEQVMDILRVVGNVPDMHTESVRKAISKKNIQGFIKYKEAFIENGKVNLNVNAEFCIDLWEQIESFAEYGFNKSVDKNTVIPFPGGEKEIKDFKSGETVYCVNEEGKTVETEVVAVHDHGVLDAFEVTFNDGYQITCSADHKFLTENGQVPLREICRTRSSICCDQYTGSTAGRDVEGRVSQERRCDVASNRHDMFQEQFGRDAGDAGGVVQVDAGHAPITDTGSLVSRRIVGVRSVGKRQMYDLEVSNPTHNFLLPNGIVTSNSHSYAYAYISARLLWLKAHYPLEFYTAVLMCEKDDEKFREYRLDATRHEININPVHINKSRENFHIDNGEIYFGFKNIKGLGEPVAERIVEHQPYENYMDFLNRFGTDATPVKALTSLGCFEEDQDRLTLRKFSEFFKDIEKKRRDRKNRFEAAIDKKIEELKDLLREYIGEDDADFEVMSDYTEDAEKKWEERFGEIKVEVEYKSKSKGQVKTKEVTVLSIIQTMARRRATSLKNFHEKEMEDEENPITMDQFNPASVKLDEEEEDILTTEMEVDGFVTYPKAERAYYGFQWVHQLETCLDFGKGMTIDDYLAESEVAEWKHAPIEVEIKSVRHRTSKNGKTEFYTLEVEDANARVMRVNMWMDDYTRFRDIAKKGELVRMDVRPPSGGFNTLTFYSYPRHERKNMPSAENDARMVRMILPKKEEEIKIDETQFEFLENA